MGVGNWGGVGRSSQGESISSSVLGVTSGDGDGSGTERSLKLKGALCGRGEMSMESGTKQGDESGIGGVVTPSHLTGGVVAPSAADALAFSCPGGQLERGSLGVPACWKWLDVKRERRGVAN